MRPKADETQKYPSWRRERRRARVLVADRHGVPASRRSSGAAWRKNRKASSRFVRRSRVWTRATNIYVRSRKARRRSAGLDPSRLERARVSVRGGRYSAGGWSLKIFLFPRGFDDDKTSARGPDVRAAASVLASRVVAFDAACDAADARRAAQSATWSRGARCRTSTTPACAFRRARSAPSPRASKTTPPATRCAARRLLDLEEVAAASPGVGAGATEVCMQGGIHPEFTGEPTSRCSRVAARRSACTRFRWRCSTARRRSREARCAGTSLRFGFSNPKTGSLPGTAAEILSDEERAACARTNWTRRGWRRRRRRRRGRAYDGDDDVPAWAGPIEARAAVAIRDARTVRVVGRGSIDGGCRRGVATRSRIDRARRVQRRVHEFVPLPSCTSSAGVPPRRDAARPDAPRVRTRARGGARVLGGAGLVNVQASWVKWGRDGGRAAARGCRDLGGADEREHRAPPAHGREMGPEELREMATREKRVPKMRTTLYADARNQFIETRARRRLEALWL